MPQRRAPQIAFAPAVAVLASLLAASVRSLSAQEQVQGLLTLPGVFGDEPCQRYSPDEIRLFSTPSDRRAIGTIRVDVPWTMAPGGGCEGLSVNVHRADTSAPQPLPTREFDYERPAAVVLDHRDRWFRIRLADGAAWIQQPSGGEFLPLQRLLTGSLTYLTEEWDGRLAPTAAGPLRGSARADISDQPVRVIGFRVADGVLWTQVEVLDQSGCESGQEPTVTSRGWVPANAVSGEPTVWFYSRGC